MDFETFAESLLSFLKQSDNLYLVLYAVTTCILTQIVKKLFIDKTKVEVFHQFNVAEILPFLFGVVLAVVDLLFVQREPFGWDFVAKVPVTAVAIGALSSVIFKAFSALSGKNLKSLMKDDEFCVFYAQLLFASEIREKLSDGSMSLQDLVQQVQALADSAKEIYADNETSAEEKKAQLLALLTTAFGETLAQSCVAVLHSQLLALS